ncbi:dnaJ subfamily C member 13-like [Sarcoptes scabiei]|nr:dnaJ subfamily C member 13-like [Sarcoptes scabiei]
MSKIFKLSKCLNTQQNNPNFDKLIYLAKSFLAENKIIALPTDTVYGLAANVQSFDAIHRLYKIKGRDRGKPLAICLGDIDEIYQYCEVTIPKTLLVQLLPGPITVVFPKTNLIGIRIPKNEFIRRICRVSGPIALTSANHSLEGSTISVEQFRDLWPQIDGIFDGGPLNENNPKALGSTN